MLKGQAKKDYQREWVRQKRARVRQQGSTDVKTPLDPKQVKLTELRSLITQRQAPQSKSSPIREEPRVIVPLYNPSIHQAGDRVRILRGKRFIETVIPELDGSGQPVPSYW